ncbi:MAG: hypothetical protein M1835_007413 [Candelina submexicana]|nr:MAG: hypothetical protein M1835_007413 [Candelina submexicana]
MGGVPLNAFSDAKKTLKGMFKRSRKGKQAEQPPSQPTATSSTPAKPSTSTEAPKATTTPSSAPQLPPTVTATGPSLDPASSTADRPAPADPLPVKDSIPKESDTNKALPREPTSAEPGKVAAAPPTATAAAGNSTKPPEGISTTTDGPLKATEGVSTAAAGASKTNESILPPNTHVEKPLPYTNPTSATGMSATSGPLDDHPAQFSTGSSGGHQDEEETGDTTPFATPMEAPMSGGFEKPTETMDATVKGDAGASKIAPVA